MHSFPPQLWHVNGGVALGILGVYLKLHLLHINVAMKFTSKSYL